MSDGPEKEDAPRPAARETRDTDDDFEQVVELLEQMAALKDKERARSRIIDAATKAQETERRISEDYKTKWHVALGEIDRLKAELSRHHLSKSYYNPDRMACEYR